MQTPGIDERESQLLALLRREGPLSRQDVHERTGLRPNTVGNLAEGMIRRGLLREGHPRANGPGRPRVPLEIDPQRRQVLGLSLQPGSVAVTRMNLHGVRVGAAESRRVRGPQAVEAATQLLQSQDLAPLVAIGVSVTGFVDVQTHRLLMSSAVPRAGALSLQPIYDAAGDRRVIVENDLQALAVQWMLTHEAESADDLLLVHVRDGAIGAAVLVGGRPIRGCVMAGNELGHTRLPVETDRCFCGGRGCLERLFSTRHLRRRRGEQGFDAGDTLADAIARDDDPTLGELEGYLAMGIANAVNLLRPRRLVLASEFHRHVGFTNRLLRLIHEGMLSTLVDRVRIDLWDRPTLDFSEAAGWLALASIYREEWVRGGVEGE